MGRRYNNRYPFHLNRALSNAVEVVSLFLSHSPMILHTAYTQNALIPRDDCHCREVVEPYPS